MPLTVYKRRHTKQCLETLARRVERGEIAPFSSPEDLKQYRHCRCAWWLAEGTNDYGRKFTRRSLGVFTWEAACLELKKLNQPTREIDVTLTDLGAAISEWKESLQLKEASEGTILSYLTGTGQLTRYYAAVNATSSAAKQLKRVSDLTPAHIDSMRLEWIERGLERSSRNTYLKFIKRFLKFCMKRGYIVSNPAEGVESAPETKKRRLGDDPDEENHVTLPLDVEGTANWDRILAAAADFIAQRGKRGPQRESGFARYPLNFVALLRLMYETGLRISDATFFDVDRLEMDGQGGIYTTVQIKTGHPVTVFPSLDLCRFVTSLPRLYGGKYLFYDGRTKWKTFVNVHARIPLQKLGESLGIADVRPHRFRDSFAVNQRNLGVSMPDLRDLLGHTDIATTEKYYGPKVKSRTIHLRDRYLNAGKPAAVIAFPKRAKRVS